jgi:hypothetical protein
VARVLTISSGHSAAYLLDAVATGRENYYTGAVAAGEPPGRWYGTGADALGLSGLVDHQDMTALYERFLDPRDERFRDPQQWDQAATLGHTGRRYRTEEELYDAALDAEPDASPERRAELRLDAGQRARRNVAFLDATFSVQKSVTVLHAAFEAQEVAARKAGDHEAAKAWGRYRAAVEDSIWAGNRALLDYLAEHAGYSRIGHHGGAAGRFIDAHDWTVASFFQHDSRDHDPQLHIHNAILNRVEGADGEWRTVDGRAVYAFRGAAAAVGERTMEEHLTRALGVRFATRPDGKAREILGVPREVIDLLSSRRRAITPKTAELAAAFEAEFGRAPNAYQLDRLYRQATFATRKAKSYQGETREQFLQRVDRQCRAEVDTSLAKVAHDVLKLAGQHVEPQQWSPPVVIETALEDVKAKKSSWTEADLTRSISNALPDYLGGLSGRQVATLLDGVTAEALSLVVPLDTPKPGDDVLPDRHLLANGRSAFDAPGRRRFATPDQLHTERLLVASTAQRGAPALATTSADEFVAALAERGVELGVDQAAAVRGILTSGARIESLVGPAGTGKSFILGTLARAWQNPTLWDGQQHRVIGLATSELATQVLTGEGLAARNVKRWLAIQDRLTHGRAKDDDHEWRLRAGDLVVVDESAMADTAALAAIHQHVSRAGAKLLLTGDHRQLAAIGAGGAMELIAEAGASYELAEVRRFTAEWEREASLRLRAADKTVLEQYHKHGRLLDAGTVEQAQASAETAWLADTLAGQHSLLIVNTNEQAADICASLRAELVRLGLVEETGVPLGLQGTYAGVGDLVQARMLDWDLAGYEGNRRGPINREHYRVLATRDDGGLVVAPIIGCGPDGESLGETMTLPGRYVAQHVVLGYASTVHSVQGLTVDTCHAVVTPKTGAANLYVGLSRGRHSNTAHVTTRAVPADAPPGAVHDAMHRNPSAVLADILETAEVQRSALASAAESEHDAESIQTPGERFAVTSELATAGRTARWLDQLVNDGHLTAAQRLAVAAEDSSRKLSPLLRRVELAGHDAHRVLVDAVTCRPLDDAHQISNVLHQRITAAVSLDPVGGSYADWIPQVDDPQDQRYLAALADAADARRHDLGEQTAAEQPPWALEAFGPVPYDEIARDQWQTKAGIVAAHRELTGHDNPTTALGPPPNPRQSEAAASWRAAWRALGRPTADRDELLMTDGQLRIRIRAYEREEAWAPPYVANELAGTTQAAATQRQNAALCAAEANATTDAAVRGRLECEAADAAALAEVLDARAAELIQADDARAQWLVHTAATRAASDRAKYELAARYATNAQEDIPLITAEEWLAEHAATMRAEDPYRDITDETELANIAEQRSNDLCQLGDQPPADAAEAHIPDIRAVAAAEPKRAEHDAVRVPSAQESADAIARAQRALVEIRQRRAVEDQHAVEQARAQQLARWRDDDHAADLHAHEQATDRGTPSMEMAAPHA